MCSGGSSRAGDCLGFPGLGRTPVSSPGPLLLDPHRLPPSSGNHNPHPTSLSPLGLPREQTLLIKSLILRPVPPTHIKLVCTGKEKKMAWLRKEKRGTIYFLPHLWAPPQDPSNQSICLPIFPLPPPIVTSVLVFQLRNLLTLPVTHMVNLQPYQVCSVPFWMHVAHYDADFLFCFH